MKNEELLKTLKVEIEENRRQRDDYRSAYDRQRGYVDACEYVLDLATAPPALDHCWNWLPKEGAWSCGFCGRSEKPGQIVHADCPGYVPHLSPENPNVYRLADAPEPPTSKPEGPTPRSDVTNCHEWIFGESGKHCFNCGLLFDDIQTIAQFRCFGPSPKTGPEPAPASSEPPKVFASHVPGIFLRTEGGKVVGTITALEYERELIANKASRFYAADGEPGGDGPGANNPVASDETQS